jgi:hypothetical protein
MSVFYFPDEGNAFHVDLLRYHYFTRAQDLRRLRLALSDAAPIIGWVKRQHRLMGRITAILGVRAPL